MYDTMNVRKLGSDRDVTSIGESERLTRARNASCAIACVANISVQVCVESRTSYMPGCPYIVALNHG